jgi:hypothetical protein
MRASDTAQRMTESLAPMQQQRAMAAFRVQGVEALLYNKLDQGRVCPCANRNPTVTRLAPDGKASVGAINRVLTGQSKFGIKDYNGSTASPEEDFNDANFHDAPTSPTNPFNHWLNDLVKVGGGESDDEDANLILTEAELGDNGQFSPDLDKIFDGFDMSHLGITDVSCPICFGTAYVGGYSPFRSFRRVIIASDFQTTSTLDLQTDGAFALTPGVHTITTVLPKGLAVLDVFRTFNGRKVSVATYKIDGQSLAGKNPRQFFDGLPHVIEVTTSEPLTHMEIQGGVSTEPIYFEFPKRGSTTDISVLDNSEPFTIIISPDVPHLDILDVIAESQMGKLLVVQNANPWNTRNRSTLGWEATVRVAQPQELYNILPLRRPVTGQKTTRGATPAKTTMVSGVVTKGMSF